MTAPLRLALAALLLATTAPARADEEVQQEVGVPMPESTEPAPPAETATGTPPPANGIPAYAAQPIDVEAVHRPEGVWGGVAAAADALLLRPIGFVSLFAGSATFLAVSPVSAATQTLGDGVDALRDRARDVFTRPLGAL